MPCSHTQCTAMYSPPLQTEVLQYLLKAAHALLILSHTHTAAMPTLQHSIWSQAPLALQHRLDIKGYDYGLPPRTRPAA